MPVTRAKRRAVSGVTLRFALMTSFSEGFPSTLDVSTWYFTYSLLWVTLPVGLVLYAFWISLGGRPLVAEDV